MHPSHSALRTSGAAVALAALFGPLAQAQSNVTLFGVYGVALRQTQVSGMPSLKTMATNGMAGTRFGLRGIEDLGGGMKAGRASCGSPAPA